MKLKILVVLSLFANFAHADFTVCGLKVNSPQVTYIVDGSEFMIDNTRQFNGVLKTTNGQMFRLATITDPGIGAVDQQGFLSFHAIGQLNKRESWFKIDSIRLSDSNRPNGVTSKGFRIKQVDGYYEVFATCRNISAEEALVKTFNKAFKKSEVDF